MLNGINSVNLRSHYSYDQKRQDNLTFQEIPPGTQKKITETEQKAAELGKRTLVKAYEAYYKIKPKIKGHLKKVEKTIEKCAEEGKNKAEK